MKIEPDKIKKILEFLDDSECVFVPVALLAKRLGGTTGEGFSSLEDWFVAHLLHLQDQGCFVNINNDSDWTYKFKNAPEQEYREIIINSINTNHFNTPHIWDPYDKKTIIRITTTGRELLSILKESDDKISSKIKQMILESGANGIKEGVTSLIKQGILSISVN